MNDKTQTLTAYANNDIIFYCGTFSPDPSEMLRITPTHFFVRGVEVPIDENEARTVYEAVREFFLEMKK